MTTVSGDAGGEQRITLPRNRGASRDARRFVERVLQPRHIPKVALEDALLVSSELVSNAFRHGSGSIELRLKVLRDRLRVEVVDQGEAQSPSIREHDADETGGWGLRIVQHLSLQWGVFEGTTHVWAELALA